MCPPAPIMGEVEDMGAAESLGNIQKDAKGQSDPFINVGGDAVLASGQADLNFFGDACEYYVWRSNLLNKSCK